MKSSLATAIMCFVFLCLSSDVLSASDQQSPVTDSHIATVHALFQQNGIPKGFAVLDRYGRIELKGEYRDEKEVDRAFSLSQTVVGIKWVSPVTPENIRVKEWEKRFGSLFSRARVLTPAGTYDAPPGPIRNRYALVVGVGHFKYGKSPNHPRGIEPLQFAVRDAKSYYQFLIDPQRGGFPRDHIIFLIDQDATRANIANALERLKSLAGVDDLVTVYISSHGTPPDKFGGVFIVAYDTEVIPREGVWHTAIGEKMLRDFVGDLRAKRLIMILDACYSNGAYRDVPGFLPPGGKSLGASEAEGYGIGKDYGKRLLGAKDIVIEEAPERAQVKTRSAGTPDGWGKVLIGASGAGEQSWESDSLHNSIFTYYYLDGLNRYGGSVKNAFYHAKPLVNEKVKEEKGADIDQNPQVLATNNDWDMHLSHK